MEKENSSNKSVTFYWPKIGKLTIRQNWAAGISMNFIPSEYAVLSYLRKLQESGRNGHNIEM